MQKSKPYCWQTPDCNSGSTPFSRHPENRDARLSQRKRNSRIARFGGIDLAWTPVLNTARVPNPASQRLLLLRPEPMTVGW